MLGWRIMIHRGGSVQLNVSGNDFEVVDGKIILRTGDITDAFIMEPLSLALQAGRAKCYGGGYPLIWELAAKDIPDFLTALDNRHYGFMDDNPKNAHELLKRLGIADDETLLVEAWDQS